MSYGDHKLFLYEDVVDLVIGSDGLYVDNRPMNNKRLTAHKGLSNEIVFNIRNKDRKLQNVNSDVLRGTLIHPRTGKRVFSRVLEHTGTTGQVKLNMAEGDLTTLDEGLYQLYVSRETSDSLELPVFADQNNNIKFDIQVLDQTKKTPIDTQTSNVSQLIQVTNTNNGDSSNTFVTSALKGNQARNFTSCLHSIAIYPDTFTGNFSIQASCVENTPDTANNSSDWFNIESDVSLTANSTIYHSTFQVNANYIRVMSEPTAGNISLVQLRN
tara:strand:- start:1706 stop:2515 length:810 start_codon:yes stop_codon:yes gene_type:complete